ncbi:MAG TPA: hypothetical protein PK847_02635 [Candidatus Sumerlaeota bacterium]|nr:hypothetical protein [Candidatus Sumerlaeota bacterium]
MAGPIRHHPAMSRALPAWAPWLGLVALSLLFYWPLALGRVPMGADNTLFYAPYYVFRWDDGLPLWNPCLLAGTPLFNDLQAALLYPLRWPFYFLADWRAYYGLFNYLHYLVAFAGGMGFLRAAGIAPWPALAGAMLFAAGGHMAGRIINPTIFHASCWLPWILWAGAGVGARHRWLTTLAWAMVLTIASPHLMFYGVVAMAAVWIPLAAGPLRRARGWRAVAGDAAARVGHFGLAFALAAPTWIPGVLRARDSIRSTTSAMDNLANSLGWGEIPRALLGGTGGAVYPEFIDKSLYIGPVALALIVGWAAHRAAWRDPRTWSGAALVLLGIGFALGRHIGIQFVMPWVPGFNLLAGPARALVLAAAGLGLLLALALADLWREGDPAAHGRRRRVGVLALTVGLVCIVVFTWRAWGRAASEGSAPFAEDWLAAWLRAPKAVPPELQPWLEAAVALPAAGIVLLLPAMRRRAAACLMAVLLAGLLQHFVPRVAPPYETAEDRRVPESIAWLTRQHEAAARAGRPFRVAGYDPLRLHDTEMDSRFRAATLMPNLATLYGLEDIHGFNPLITLDYLELFLRTAGRSPINDPYRNLTIDRPDPRLFQILNLRYLAGHPYERRLTSTPQTLRPQAATQPVVDWEDRGTSEPIVAWLFVSLLDGAGADPATLPIGAEVARLLVEAEEGRFAFPVRNGVETAWLHAPSRPELLRRDDFSASVNDLWSTHIAAPALDDRLATANYRGRIEFGRPLHVRRLAWELAQPGLVFHLAGQAYRIAPPPEEEEPWRLAYGAHSDWAPIFEFRAATPRFALWEPAAAQPAPSTAPPRPLPGVAEGDGVALLERGNHTLRLRVEAPRPALLVLREIWTPGWSAEVNGTAAEVIRVHEVLRGVPVPAGRSDVTLVYRPASFYVTLLCALPFHLVGLGVAARDLRRWRARSGGRGNEGAGWMGRKGWEK